MARRCSNSKQVTCVALRYFGEMTPPTAYTLPRIRVIRRGQRKVKSGEQFDQWLTPKTKTKPKLLLCSLFYAKVCNEFACSSPQHSNLSICWNGSKLFATPRFGRPGIRNLDLSHTRHVLTIL